MGDRVGPSHRCGNGLRLGAILLPGPLAAEPRHTGTTSHRGGNGHRLGAILVLGPLAAEPLLHAIWQHFVPVSGGGGAGGRENRGSGEMEMRQR